jgi:hypothetical protein
MTNLRGAECLGLGYRVSGREELRIRKLLISNERGSRMWEEKESGDRR